MHELTLRAPEALVEAVSDALMDELDALSVSVEDADAGTAAEQALFGEPGMPVPQGGWQQSVLKALFEQEDAATAAATVLLAQVGQQGLRVTGMQAVADADWVRLTQSQFAPVAITDDFWIVPTWHDPPAAARRLIRLDPGLAFGTGTHPTTRMCLRWVAQAAAQASAEPGALSRSEAHDTHGAALADAAAPWPRVLDYGCGSGILAIAAGLYGARGIEAVDIDPAALEATQANAAANGVVLTAALPAAAQGVYPLVLANILATPLKLLAPLLCGHLAPGGWLVLAGILERQTEELRAAYAPWLDLQVQDQEDGWVLMTGRLGAGLNGNPNGPVA